MVQSLFSKSQISTHCQFPLNPKRKMPCHKKEEEESQKVYYPVSINGANTEHPFPNNRMRTTKYTLLTFLPKNLWEQYHKLTNVCPVLPSSF